jgi:hypothetical protein
MAGGTSSSYDRSCLSTLLSGLSFYTSSRRRDRNLSESPHSTGASCSTEVVQTIPSEILSSCEIHFAIARKKITDREGEDTSQSYLSLFPTSQPLAPSLFNPHDAPSSSF